MQNENRNPINLLTPQPTPADDSTSKIINLAKEAKAQEEEKPNNAEFGDTKIAAESDLENTKRIDIKFFLSTVIILFLTLLASPVITTVRDGYDLVGPLLNGTMHAPHEDVVPGILIAGLGWLGVVYLSVSWFWFLGFFYILFKVNTGAVSLIRHLALNLFLIFCLIGLYAVFPGNRTPGDIDCQCTENYKLLGGFYVYIILIFYMTIVSNLFFSRLSKDFINSAVKILSVLVVIISIVVAYFFSIRVFRSDFNLKAKTYLSESDKQYKNIKEYPADVKYIVEEVMSSVASNISDQETKETISFRGYKKIEKPNREDSLGVDGIIILNYRDNNLISKYSNQVLIENEIPLIRDTISNIRKGVESKQLEYFGKTLPILFKIEALINGYESVCTYEKVMLMHCLDVPRYK